MSLSITEDAILTALRAFLLAVLPAGVEVIQGQVNRVPEPTSPDFVMMIPTNRTRLSANVDTWDTVMPPVQMAAAHPTQLSVQLDIHGPNGSDNAQIITTLWRDSYACDAIDPAVFQPLFATDGRQAPFINGENQYENRWTLELALQANPIVSTPAPFADSVRVTIEGPPQ